MAPPLLCDDPATLRPDPSGFRPRGLDATRIETFVDAAFAFAVTLLVITLDLPETVSELLQTLWTVPAFAMSFAILMLFWAGHHRCSRRFGLDDTPTIFLSLVLVFVVLVYVYPLRFVFTTFFEWIRWQVTRTGDVTTLAEPTQINNLFAVYGIGFAAMSGLIVLLNLHALRLKDRLALSPLETFDTRAEIRMWSFIGAVGLVSTVLAVLLPKNVVGIPGWIYCSLGIVMPIWGKRVNRQRETLRAADPTPT